MGRPKQSVAPDKTEAGPPPLPRPEVGPTLHIMRVIGPSSQTGSRSLPEDVQVSTDSLLSGSWTEFGIAMLGCLGGIDFGGQDANSNSDSDSDSDSSGTLTHTHTHIPPLINFPDAWNSHDFSGRNALLTSTYTSSATACFCTRRLFAGLDAISAMNDFWTALGNTRHVSRTVYQVLKCPLCIATFGRSSEPSPTIMLLATVVYPSLVTSYSKLVEMVKKETKSARQRNTPLLFDLERFGGLWGPLSESSVPCQEYYSNLFLDAEAWGTTVRALLRADIHGVDFPKRNEGENAWACHQPGLVDFLKDIEEVLGNGWQGKFRSDATVLVSQMIQAAQQSLNQLVLI